METNSTPKFAVTFGISNFFSDDGLKTIFASSAAEVKELATRFITVIPDDPDSYEDDVKAWDGQDTLTITHDDDETFLFMATPIAATPVRSDFDSFITKYVVED